MRKKLHSVTAFDVILAIFMVLICFACVYPMWYILANSLAALKLRTGAGCVVAKGFEPGCL